LPITLFFLNNGKTQVQGTLSSLWTLLNPHIRLVLRFASLPKEGWDKDLPLTHIINNNNRIEMNIREKSEIPDIIDRVVAAGGKLLSCSHEEESISEIYTRLSKGECK